MTPQALYRRCQDLQIAVDWSAGDLRAIAVISPSLDPAHSLIHDIHAQIKRQPNARDSVIGQACAVKAPGWAQPDLRIEKPVSK